MMFPALVPVNLSVADVHVAANLAIPVAAEMPLVPTVHELNSWSQEAYSLDLDAAASLGFPVGNGSVTYKRQALMFGVSRWRDVTARDHTYRFGISLRAIIIITDIKGSGTLTLPVIAAKVEIEGARATAQLLVRGYKGVDLANSLPAWQSFGVDAYADYMRSVSRLQKTIMGATTDVEPELLATTVASPASLSPSAAVGVVYALHAIAEGATRAHAVDRLKTMDDEVAKTVRSIYEARIGQCEKTTPDEPHRKAVEKELCGLHLSHGWFGR